MSTAIVSRRTTDVPRPLPPHEADYDVRVNALTVDELFALYERTGFLYPAKAARLLPHLDVVRDNWRRLLRADDALLYVLTAGNDREGHASVAVWRTTGDSWVWQHLVCEHNPLRSRPVMLGGLVRCMRSGVEKSQQNWFRPENRFPARVFGSMVGSLGESFASVRSHLYFAVPRRPALHSAGVVRIVPCDRSHRDALCAVAARARGSVYVTSEDLEGDIGLESVDSLYRRVGLRRTRHIWLAYLHGMDAPAGAALAYRGPLGLNFSFLENRCDLLLDPALAAADAAAVTSTLIDAARAAYTDFELEEFPVVADTSAAPALRTLGGQFLRNYCQGIWLKDGQPLLYEHVNRFYARLVQRRERRVVPPAATA